MTERGFTLIELSIVLVIIGLIVGGVLVGQDLIRAAEVRATITQVEKFNTAVNTFYGKFQALPGDMNYSTAMNFGFSSGTTSSQATGCGGRSPGYQYGNGDGLITGPVGYGQGMGETGCFWVDLSSTAAGNLIDGGFSTATESAAPTATSITGVSLYLPTAKIGRGNFFYVYSTAGLNFYGLSNVTSVNENNTVSTTSLSPIQAYNIDKKIDDGFPNSGNVFAYYLFLVGGFTVAPYASQNHAPGVAGDCWDSTGATTGSSPPITTMPLLPTGAQGSYMTGTNQGNGASCGLSFKFQ